MVNKYTTIQIPEKFVTGLIDVLVDRPGLGYSSRSEVVKDAVRTLYAKYIGFGEPILTRKSDPFTLSTRQNSTSCVKVIFTRHIKENEVEYIYQSETLSAVEKNLIKSSWESKDTEKTFINLHEHQGVINYIIKIKPEGTKTQTTRLMLSLLMEETLFPQLEYKATSLMKDLMQTLLANQMIEKDKLKTEKWRKNLPYWLEGLANEINAYANNFS